jgi:hypothetical protein
MTTMSDISANDLTAAHIALLVASYGKKQDTSAVSPQSAPSKLKVAKAAKASAKVSDGSQAAPIERQVITTAALPAAGTISARDFFIAMRRATDRNSRIVAIASYKGFSPTESYSSQELAATMAARREMNPPKSSPPVVGAAVSLRGYVAGANDPMAKKRANLIGREVYAAEEMTTHLSAARAARSAEERAHHTAMAQVESERLAQIRSDLAAL